MNPTQLFILYFRRRNSGSKTLSYMIRQYSKQTRVFMKTMNYYSKHRSRT